MDTVKIKIKIKHDSVPPSIKINCCNNIVFNSVLEHDKEFNFTVEIKDRFFVEITKKGKTKQLVDIKHAQELSIEQISLNGIDLKTKEFGEFDAKENDYVEDHVLHTAQCNLNGIWRIELPLLHVLGQVVEHRLKNTRDRMDDCDIACFGCSQTYGTSLEEHQTWPRQLASLTDKQIKNFGRGGSNINEISAFIDYYLERHTCETIIILLPYSMRKQIVNNRGVIENIHHYHPANKENVFHGEEHIISSIAGRFDIFLKEIKAKGINIFFGVDHPDEFKTWQLTQCKDYMLPYLRDEGYQKAPDGVHSGSRYWKDYATLIKEYVDKSR